MATRKQPKKPEAVPVNTVCSVCGVDWKRHGVNPTTDDCIRLLKEDIEILKRDLSHERVKSPYVPVPVPYRPEPSWPYRQEPYWRPPVIYSTAAKETTHFMTPASGQLTCSAL
jgi:hypothetical protein